MNIYTKNKDFKEYFPQNTVKLKRCVELLENPKKKILSETKLELVKRYTKKLERVFCPVKYVTSEQDLVNHISSNICCHKTPILQDVCEAYNFKDENAKQSKMIFETYFKNELSKKTKVILYKLPDKQKSVTVQNKFTLNPGIYTMRNDFIDIYDFLENDYKPGFLENKIEFTESNIKNIANKYHERCVDAFISSSTNFKDNLHIPSSYLNYLSSPSKPPEESLQIHSINPRVPIYDNSSTRQMQNQFTSSREFKNLSLSQSIFQHKDKKVFKRLSMLRDIVRKYDTNYQYMIFTSGKFEEFMPHLGPYNPSLAVFDMFDDRNKSYLKYFIDDKQLDDQKVLFDTIESLNSRTKESDKITLHEDTIQNISTNTFDYFNQRNKYSNRIILWLKPGDSANYELERKINNINNKFDKNIVIAKMITPDTIPEIKENVNLPAIIVKFGQENTNIEKMTILRMLIKTSEDIENKLFVFEIDQNNKIFNFDVNEVFNNLN